MFPLCRWLTFASLVWIVDHPPASHHPCTCLILSKPSSAQLLSWSLSDSGRVERSSVIYVSVVQWSIGYLLQFLPRWFSHILLLVFLVFPWNWGSWWYSPLFPSTLFLNWPLCQLFIEEVDIFGFSIKEFWLFEDGDIEELDACVVCAVNRDCSIGLSGSQGKWDSCWEFLCRIDYSYSCLDRSSSDFTGFCAGWSRQIDRPSRFGHLECSYLGKSDLLLLLIRLIWNILSVGTSRINCLVNLYL